MRFRFLALMLVIMGCTTPEPPRFEAVPAAGLAPVHSVGQNGFDGDYRGTMRLVHDGSPGCQTVAGPRMLTVRHGRASMVIDPNLGSIAEGFVRPDGSLQMVGLTYHRLEMVGLVVPPRVRASFTNPRCVLEFEGLQGG